MNKEELALAEQACRYIKVNKKLFTEHFASPFIFQKQSHPISFFMAGSPGAGKTEFSKQLIQKFSEAIVRIDPDEIRQMLPGYTGSNSYIFQAPCSLGVDILFNSCIKNKQDFLLDGMLVNYEKSVINIERCLKHNRGVEIFYIFQEPTVAWDFTKKRELMEQRNIPKDAFIRGFLRSRENVDRIKTKFMDRIQIHAVLKNYKNDVENVWLNINKVDNYIPNPYTENKLNDLII